MIEFNIKIREIEYFSYFKIIHVSSFEMKHDIIHFLCFLV